MIEMSAGRTHFSGVLVSASSLSDVKIGCKNAPQSLSRGVEEHGDPFWLLVGMSMLERGSLEHMSSAAAGTVCCSVMICPPVLGFEPKKNNMYICIYVYMYIVVFWQFA